VNGATAYAVQQSPNPPSPGTWVQVKTTGRTSKTTIGGLTSGLQLWFRVAAIRGDEQGPWSDPATKFVP